MPTRPSPNRARRSARRRTSGRRPPCRAWVPAPARAAGSRASRRASASAARSPWARRAPSTPRRGGRSRRAFERTHEHDLRSVDSPSRRYARVVTPGRGPVASLPRTAARWMRRHGDPPSSSRSSRGGGRAAGRAHGVTAVGAVRADPARDALERAEALPPDAATTVTASPSHGIEATIDLCEGLTGTRCDPAPGGPYVPGPHAPGGRAGSRQGRSAPLGVRDRRDAKDRGELHDGTALLRWTSSASVHVGRRCRAPGGIRRSPRSD